MKRSKKYIDLSRGGEVITLEETEAFPETAHVFQTDTIYALNAALAARRPLLVWGEPGCGKSQLARAAAKELGRRYVPFVVDSRTESRDLLWDFDAVARLSEAQTLAARPKISQEEVEERLKPANFLHPGPLWWAFNWERAKRQAMRAGGRNLAEEEGEAEEQRKGCVVLIDEIDKAESDVPNGLLEALGSQRFQPEGLGEPVVVGDERPLVIVTTNAERALPAAFLRRCLVLHLEIPGPFVEAMITRGQKHFPEVGKEVLKEAAKLIEADRKAAAGNEHRPGQAEYLDLIRAVSALEPEDSEAQLKTLEQIKKFVMNKRKANRL